MKETEFREEISVDFYNSEGTADQWDIIIEPKTSLFDLKLKEVWHSRDLLLLFMYRDFVAVYKQTILGPIWHFIQPIFTTIMFLLVFGKIAGIPTDGVNPVLFYMSGITIWNYFSSCLTSTSDTFLSNAGIFGKVYFHRLISPLSTVAGNLVKFVIQFLLLLAIMVYIGITTGHFHFGLTWFLIPVLVAMMAMLGLGLGLIISSLTIRYRDLKILLGFGVQLMMYATPVAYPMSFLRQKPYTAWIRWNPLSPIVEAFRYALFGEGYFSLFYLGYSFIFTAVILFGGLLVFNKVEKMFMDTV